jgi:aerobic-type carbon monoxide dehydrogenase small subunit (CoxS/CutS family)
MSTKRAIDLTINGKRHQRLVAVRMTLADFLRHDIGLTGTHVGCEHGLCGACTILFNGEAVRSCLLLAVQADGANLTTIEGLCASGQLNPLQLAFQEQHALQCGFCTPGMLVTAYAFLNETPRPTEAQVREAISGNICRCTGYQPIIKAILQAAEMGEIGNQRSEVRGQLSSSRS